jgi:hypothetical protein
MKEPDIIDIIEKLEKQNFPKLSHIFSQEQLENYVKIIKNKLPDKDTSESLNTSEGEIFTLILDGSFDVKKDENLIFKYFKDPLNLLNKDRVECLTDNIIFNLKSSKKFKIFNHFIINYNNIESEPFQTSYLSEELNHYSENNIRYFLHQDIYEAIYIKPTVSETLKLEYIEDNILINSPFLISDDRKDWYLIDYTNSSIARVWHVK